LIGDLQQELVRDQVRQLRDVQARQKRLESQMIQAYQRLPAPNHLDTIKGIGDVTAAVLTAFILDIDRFATPNQLVKYFGAMPTEGENERGRGPFTVVNVPFSPPRKRSASPFLPPSPRPFLPVPFSPQEESRVDAC